MKLCPSEFPDQHREPIYHGNYSFNTGRLNEFTTTDYFIVAFILMVSSCVGFFFGWVDRDRESVTEFLLAGRRMDPWTVGISIMGSFMSAITLLGTPAEMYTYTFIYLWMGVGYFLVSAGSAHLYMPMFYNLGLTSAYEYLERRFSKGVRTVASMAFVFQMIVYMAIVLYAPSLALNAVTGFPLWGSVVSVGVVCTFYTAVGGMKAVIWTDGLQVFLMFISLSIILVKGALVVGSWQVAWDSAERMNRLIFWDFRLDPTIRQTVWTLVVGSYFTWTALFGVNQVSVQRALTCRTLKDAQFALWINFPLLCVLLYLCCFVGMFLSAFYENCDPLSSKFIVDKSQLLPLFVMDIFGGQSGLPGLFVGGLFCGALSTISSGLNSIAAVFLEDVLRSYVLIDLSEGRAKIMSQAFVITYGFVCLCLSYVASKLGTILQAALSVHGAMAGPLLGLFSLGMFFPWANKWGALSGLCVSLVLSVWIGAGGTFVYVPRPLSGRCINNCKTFDIETLKALMNVTKDDSDVPFYFLYTVSYMWLSLIAVSTCITVGLIVSFATGATDPKSVDPRLICPLADHLFPFMYLPENVRKPLRFGIIHEDKYKYIVNPNMMNKTSSTASGLQAKRGSSFTTARESGYSEAMSDFSRRTSGISDRSSVVSEESNSDTPGPSSEAPKKPPQQKTQKRGGGRQPRGKMRGGARLKPN